MLNGPFRVLEPAYATQFAMEKRYRLHVAQLGGRPVVRGFRLISNFRSLTFTVKELMTIALTLTFGSEISRPLRTAFSAPLYPRLERRCRWSRRPTDHPNDSRG